MSVLTREQQLIVELAEALVEVDKKIQNYSYERMMVQKNHVQPAIEKATQYFKDLANEKND